VKKKLTPEQIEQMAKEIRSFLLENEMWVDTTIYFNGKAYSTSDKENKNFYYNDPEHLVEFEDDPRRYFEYVGEILSMSFEGPLCDCINGYGTYRRSFERKIVDGLGAIFKKYGCYCELGHHWNLTLYYL